LDSPIYTVYWPLLGASEVCEAIDGWRTGRRERPCDPISRLTFKDFMRRLLLIPAALLVLVGSPVLALENTPPPPVTSEAVPVVAPDVAVGPGWESPVTATDATLVGVSWEGDPAASFAVEVQYSDGNWTKAEGLINDIGTDSGTAEAARVDAIGNQGTEPVWVGSDATAVRVVVESGSVSDVTLNAVTSEVTGAPSGAAGALASALSLPSGTERFAFGGALLLIAAVLVAIALGWSPRRDRLRLTALLAVVALTLVACRPPPPAPTPLDGSVQPAITGRGAWGARGFACGSVDYAPALKFAVVHHTAGSNNYNADASPAIIRGIQNYHMDALGYCDIAYNFLIDKYGQIFEGRAGGINRAVNAAHAGGFNTASAGVALFGDYTSISPPAAQWNSLVHLLRWRLSVAGINPALGFSTTARGSPCNCARWGEGAAVSFPSAILGHRDLNKTACPGNTFYPQLDSIRTQVQSGIVIPPATTTSSTTAATTAATAAPAAATTTSTTAAATTTSTTVAAR